MTRIAIGLGSNLGNREENLQFAREEVAKRGVTWTAFSAFYETDPVGPVTDQPPYLNQAAIGVTDLTAGALLQICLTVEAERGRVRVVRWGPRTLDIDILLYGERAVSEDGLTIPHAEMVNRAFVLLPLAEIAPDWELPGSGRTVATLAVKAAGKEGVRLWRSGDTKPPM